MSDDCPENHADWIDYKATYCPTCGVELEKVAEEVRR